MQISKDDIMQNVNNISAGIIHELGKGEFRNIPIYFTGVSKANGKLPTTACVLSETVDKETLAHMEKLYSDWLKQQYENILCANIDKCVDNYTGIKFVDEKSLNKDSAAGYCFYAINGDFYDSSMDAIGRALPLTCTLLDHDTVISCSDQSEAKELLSELRKKIGSSPVGYVDVKKFSARQTVTSQNALNAAMNKDWVSTVREIFDFLDDYGSGSYILTNSEFGILNLILCAAGL